ncbi:flagellar biosynthetic protein FliO [Burkholderia sp. LMU1-1-1.1]|uniref:flagellar biosynthetic protein FliO n=1 Tax=Burkholderia sp. LMU1-1-1.1 TaxID=3135266 RepID=UPI003434D9FB
MKHGPTLSLILAAALAAAPAIAQSTAPAADKAAATSAPATATPVVPAAAEAATPATTPAAPAATPPGPLAMTIPTPPPAAPGAGSLMQTTLALLFVLALLVGGAWFLKRFGPRNLGGAGGTVKLVGSLSLGTRERILVVEVGEQWIVVGASPGRMNALATMPRQENSEAAVPATLQTANFAEWFKQTIDKRNAK